MLVWAIGGFNFSGGSSTPQTPLDPMENADAYASKYLKYELHVAVKTNQGVNGVFPTAVVGTVSNIGPKDLIQASFYAQMQLQKGGNQGAGKTVDIKGIEAGESYDIDIFLGNLTAHQYGKIQYTESVNLQNAEF